MNNSEYYIKRVKINGLYGLKNIDWHLHKDVNILGGINGSGKSTVINLLRAFLNQNDIEENEDEYFILECIDSAEITFFNNLKLCFKKDIVDDINAFSQIANKYTNTSFGEPLTIISLGHNSFKKRIMGSYFLCSTNNKYERKRELDDFTNSYLGSAEHQIVSDDIIKGIGNDKIKTTLDLSLFQEIRKRNELVTFASLNDNPQYLQSIQDLNNLLINILNNYLIDTNKKVKKDTSTFDILTSNNKIISCYNLSTGEKQLLLIILTAFNTNREASILLMDEPDLGIHIDWKKKLIKSIREINPKAQLIFSTHSPSMIGGWFDKVEEMDNISTKI